MFWINSVVPKTSPEFFYAGGGVGAGIGEFFGVILMLAMNGVGLLMLLIGVGFFFRAKWARSWGLFFASGSLAVSSACIYSLLLTVSQGTFSLYYVAALILFSTVVVANGIVIYLVALRRSPQIQAS
jgi:hypothetical protein